MKTKIPVSLISPGLITDVIRSGSNLHFTYGDGSSVDLDIMSIGLSILSQATLAANIQIQAATSTFVLANPALPVTGSITTSGSSAFVYNNTSIKVTP